MKSFFEQIVNGLLWFILLAILLGSGYVFLVRNFLNPPKTATIPSGQPNNPPNNNPNLTTKNSPNPPQITQPIQQPTQQQKPLQDNEQLSIKRQASVLSERVITIPRELERGAILSIYENEIEETNPEPHLYEPKSIIKTPHFNLTNWHPNKGEFQEVKGFFYVPEDETYQFDVSQISHLEGKYKDRILLSLSIDGITFANRQGGKIDLQAGWHHINLYLNPKPQENYYDFQNVAFVNINWGKLNTPLKPLVTYRKSENINQNSVEAKINEQQKQ